MEGERNIRKNVFEDHMKKCQEKEPLKKMHLRFCQTLSNKTFRRS